MKDTITIGDDPWSLEYWARCQPLTDSIQPLLNGDVEPYVRYWCERELKKPAEDATEEERNRAAYIGSCYRRLAESIRDNGYQPDAWQRDERQFDVTQGHGPLCVTICHDGELYPSDGMHRSAILKALGRPVEAQVFCRKPGWETIRDYHKTLYTPCPHPDFAGRPITRPGQERFDAIADWLWKKGDVFSVLTVGACTGFGMYRLYRGGCGDKKLVGIEPQQERFQLAKSFLRRVVPEATIYPTNAHEQESFGGYNAIMGLSVYQHVATSLPRWTSVCTKLAACPVQILELPGDQEHQWHEAFRVESLGFPQGVVISTLKRFGNYPYSADIFTDTNYANRKTIALWR